MEYSEHMGAFCCWEGEDGEGSSVGGKKIHAVKRKNRQNRHTRGSVVYIPVADDKGEVGATFNKDLKGESDGKISKAQNG